MQMRSLSKRTIANEVANHESYAMRLLRTRTMTNELLSTRTKPNDVAKRKNNATEGVKHKNIHK